MESSPPGPTRTLASVIDAEKVIAPTRARALLVSLAQATTVPSGPASVRDWSEAVLIATEADGAERATFTTTGSAPSHTDRAANAERHIDALRAAAVAMLWGRQTAQGPDGLPRFPRLRKLLVDQWDDTRRTCDSADKFMMFFEATLALDRSAEPKAGREAFNTLSVPTIDAVKRDVKVGTIGVAFGAIIETGKFKKALRQTQRPQGPWPTPHLSSPVQSASPSPLPAPVAPPVQRSSMRIIIAVIVVAVIAGIAIALLK